MTNCKEFVKDLASVGTTSSKEIENTLSSILNKLPEDVSINIIDNAKQIADKNESEQLTESNKPLKQSVKELVGEIFPSLSFYPALGIWGMVDKMIQSGNGFDSLSPEQQRLLPVYMALFFGLVGGKIAYNRLKEKISTNDEIDNEINETLRLAGVQLDEDNENTEKDKNSENTEEDKNSESTEEVEIPDDVYQLISSIYD